MLTAGESAHLDVAAHAFLAAGDEVVAVVELIIGMPEDGRVPRQGLPLVEAHTCMHETRSQSDACYAWKHHRQR